jgi:exosortase A
MTEILGFLREDVRGRSFLLLSALILFLFAAYWQTLAAMVGIWWSNETYAHGFLILPISFYMLWKRRDRLARIVPQPTLWGLLPLAGLGLAWLAAYAADVQVVMQLALVGMIPALVLTLTGWDMVRAALFPLAYLLFAVPMGEALVPVLMDFTAWFTVRALDLTGIPVYLEGRFLSIPSGDFEVAEACSGVRYLIAAMALGCLYAYLTYQSLWRRLAFIALSAVVPIVANGIRAYGIVMLAHLSGMTLAVGVDHLIYGWLFFGLVMMLMFWLGSFWQEPEPEVEAPVDGASMQVSAEARSPLPVAAAALMVLLLPPLAVQALSGGGRVVPVELPTGQEPWKGPLRLTTSVWHTHFEGARSVRHWAYVNGDEPVYLLIAQYGRQEQGAELINSNNRLYDEDAWRRMDEYSREVVLGKGLTVQVREIQLQNGSGRRTIWYWYRQGGRSLVDPFRVKLLEAWTRLSGGGQGSALVALAADGGEWMENERRLRGFLRDMMDAFVAGPPVRD